MIDLAELASLSEADLTTRAHDDPDWFHEALSLVTQAAEVDRKEVQLAYYTAANPMALPIHLSTAREVAVVGGNRSGKTDTMLAELAIQMTGHIPLALQDIYPREKLRPPIRARIVCNSLTDTLEPVIKPKLRWDQWNGVGDYLTGLGHWGWIPRHCLAQGNWERAYSEKYRTLHVGVDTHWVGRDGAVNRVSGTSSCQFLSYDQDLTAFAGSSMHFVGHDELPPADLYRENRMRTLDVQGQIYTAFTPPDEAGMSRADVAWFYDDVYQRGLPGPTRDPSVESIILHTERNRVLAPADVAQIAAKLTDAQREVRLYGKFIHLTGVIYALFTTHESWWCYKCAKRMFPVDGACPTCTSDDINIFTHVVEPFIIPPTWPVVFVIDPHPRKKDAMGWFAITPSDDVMMIGEAEVDGTADDVAKEIRRWEDAHRVHPVKRLMDPNIATETNDKLGRGWTMRKAYDDVGIHCDLATDDVNAGIQEVMGLLKPDERTRRPRLGVFNTCERFIFGMTHWVWDEYARSGDKEPKEQPRTRHKDFPDLIRYLALDRPTYDRYTHSTQLVRPSGRGPRGY